MKLSPTQQSLLNAMQAAPEKKLIRFTGGYWHLEGTALSGDVFKVLLPRPYWGSSTVMNLLKRGLIKATEESKGRYHCDYILQEEQKSS